MGNEAVFAPNWALRTRFVTHQEETCGGQGTRVVVPACPCESLILFSHLNCNFMCPPSFSKHLNPQLGRVS